LIEPPSVVGVPFSVVLIPDTQHLTDSGTNIAYFQAAADWIVANRAAHNIQLVLQLGDITQNSSATEFGRAETPVDTILDEGIPYVSCIGNHDYDGGVPSADLSDTTSWNTHMGTGLYTERPWWDGDFYSSGKSENLYFRTTLGGRPTLVVVLEFYPRSAVLAWAGDVIEANPSHDVIIVTHSYLNDDGTLTEDDAEHGPSHYSLSDSSSGVEMWAEFKQYANVVAVFCAHHINGPNMAVLQSDGDEGNVVYQLFANWQEGTRGGEGRIVVLSLDSLTGRGTLAVYNGYLDSFQASYTRKIRLYRRVV